MKQTPETMETLQKLVELARQGNHTIAALCVQIGLSERQTYRYLRLGLKLGVLHCPVRGMYYPIDMKVVSFESFARSSQKNVNVRMSEKEQHNKTMTKHNDNVIEFESIHKEYRAERDTSMSLYETVSLVLTTAQMEYSEYDFNFAVRVMRDSAWWRITPDNVVPFILEVGKRYEVQAEAKAIKRHAIGYFFGILKRVLSEDVKIVMRSYKQFVAQYAAMAAGAEEVAVSVSPVPRNELQERSEVAEGIQISDGAQTSPNSLRSVPPEWLGVQSLIRQMADSKAAYRVPDWDIQMAVNDMEYGGCFPERAELALQYLDANDPVGAAYFVAHLKNRSRVFDAINKNFMRYLNFGLKKTENLVEEGSPPKDGRYNAFYQVFPDT